MGKKLLLLVLLAAFFMPSLVFAVADTNAEKLTNDQIVLIASDAVKAKGYEVVEAQVIYDQDGKLWSSRVGKMTDLTSSENFGLFRKGFMKNYRVVFFDYKEPIKDLWAFVDKDTGEVLDFYVEQQ